MSDERVWVIWSFEHDAWWAPAQRGYVASLADAGRYTEAQARQIEARANRLVRAECAMLLTEAERTGAPKVPPPPVTDEEALIVAMAEALANREPFHLVLNATATVQLAGLLQLVLRHPQLDANNRRTAVIVIEQVRAYFGDAPAILEVMRQGDDPRRDRPW